MSKIIETMQSLPDFCPGKGADAEEIEDAETQLGLVFADEYREYVKAFGDASVDGHELTGITESKRINVVEATIAERRRNPDVPESLYVVEQTHVDRIVVWQDHAGRIYQTIPGSMPVKVHETLSEYLSS